MHLVILPNALECPTCKDTIEDLCVKVCLNECGCVMALIIKPNANYGVTQTKSLLKRQWDQTGNALYLEGSALGELSLAKENESLFWARYVCLNAEHDSQLYTPEF